MYYERNTKSWLVSISKDAEIAMEDEIVTDDEATILHVLANA